MWVAAGLSTAFATAPDARVVVEGCEPSRVDLLDLDGDGIQEIVVRDGTLIYSWPSTTGQGWMVDLGDSGGGVTSATATEPAHAFVYFDFHTVEYDLLIDPPAIRERWTDEEHTAEWYVGDFDGDGVADVAGSWWVRGSTTGWQEILTSYPWIEYAWGVGDVDGDGYDDVLAARRSEVHDGEYSNQYGPAELHRGGPGGLDPVPLWTIDFGDRVGVGRTAIRIAGEPTLVLSAVLEEREHVQFSLDEAPSYLLVVRDAGSADPVVQQAVQLPLYDGRMASVVGVEDDAIVLVQHDVPYEAQWFTLPVGGVALSEQPVERWQSDVALDVFERTAPLDGAVGRPFLVMSTPWREMPQEYLAWGVSVEQPYALGTPDGACAITVEPYLDVNDPSAGPDAGAVAGATVAAPADPSAREPEGCSGCDGALHGGRGGAVPWLASVWFWRGRRALGKGAARP